MVLRGLIILIAIILVLEGTFALISTKLVVSLTKKLIKNQELLRSLGFLELLIGLALIFFAIQP